MKPTEMLEVKFLEPGKIRNDPDRRAPEPFTLMPVFLVADRASFARALVLKAPTGPPVCRAFHFEPEDQGRASNLAIEVSRETEVWAARLSR
jgi:hypothetical protein